MKEKDLYTQSKRIVLFRLSIALVFIFCVGLIGAFLTNVHWGNALAAPQSNPIVTENAKPGSTGWQVVNGQMAFDQIQAYASSPSVAVGQTLTFYVSTQQAGTKYTIDVYRLGWYGGTGGRLVQSIPSLVGKVQGYFDTSTSQLVGCTTCYVDATTGLVEARWQPSYSLTVPSTWITGVYLTKFTDVHGLQTYTSFEVLGNTHAPYAVVTADTTDAAYNNWGGRSLYDYNSKPQRASKVSFERPSTQQYGSDQALVFDADAIHWMESRGYNLSYMSGVDLHANASSLLQHKAYISIGHDEYWSKEMRDGVEYARDHGVGLAFLEADDSYWQIRFEPDAAGVANRTIVCYKVQTPNNDLSRDPLYGVDNSRVTSLWRDPVVNRPENSLIGIMFSDLTHQQKGFPWTVDAAANSSLLTNTGLVAGQSYGCGLVGYEWDKVFQNGLTPANLKVIGTTKTINDTGQPDSSNTTTYIAPSGTMIFATGAVYWTASLDSYRFDTDPHCTGQPTIVPGMQKLFVHVMKAIVVLH